MGVTFDAVSTHIGSDVTSLTKSHTTGAGANYMLACVGLDDSGATVTGVTYNGVAMTKIAHAADSGGSTRSEIWKLANPYTGGAANVVASFSTMANGATLGIMTFSEVDTSNPHGTAATAANNSGNITVNVTNTDADGMVVDSTCRKDSDISFSAGSGQTSRFNLQESGSGKIRTGGSTEPGNGGTVTMSWNTGDTGMNWSLVAVCLNPTTGYANNVNTVSGGNIGKINGIDAGNIAKVNTV